MLVFFTPIRKWDLGKYCRKEDAKINTPLALYDEQITCVFQNVGTEEVSADYRRSEF